MGHLTCSADYCRALAENGALAHEVTWPVRLRRWWESRRDRGWLAGRAEAGPATRDLWSHLERAFRLLDVADTRPDPALTRRVAAALLDEVEGHLAALPDGGERAELARAVGVVRRSLGPAPEPRAAARLPGRR